MKKGDSVRRIQSREPVVLGPMAGTVVQMGRERQTRQQTLVRWASGSEKWHDTRTLQVVCGVCGDRIYPNQEMRRDEAHAPCHPKCLTGAPGWASADDDGSFTR